MFKLTEIFNHLLAFILDFLGRSFSWNTSFKKSSSKCQEETFLVFENLRLFLLHLHMWKMSFSRYIVLCWQCIFTQCSEDLSTVSGITVDTQKSDDVHSSVVFISYLWIFKISLFLEYYSMLLGVDFFLFILAGIHCAFCIDL